MQNVVPRFTRSNNKITDLQNQGKKTTTYDSINKAKRESRKIQKIHGIGSLNNLKKGK